MDESPNPDTTSKGESPPEMGPTAGQQPEASESQEDTESTTGEPSAGFEPAEGAAGTGPGGNGSGAPGANWETGGWRVHDESARDWVGQLQGMIDSVAEHAGPVLREVAAKAAELAAVAAENAGPALQKAANVTTEVGHKVATRSKEYAAELRRQQVEQAAPGETAADQPDTDANPGA